MRRVPVAHGIDQHPDGGHCGPKTTCPDGDFVTYLGPDLATGAPRCAIYNLDTMAAPVEVLVDRPPRSGEWIEEAGGSWRVAAEVFDQTDPVEPDETPVIRTFTAENDADALHAVADWLNEPGSTRVLIGCWSTGFGAPDEVAVQVVATEMRSPLRSAAAALVAADEAGEPWPPGALAALRDALGAIDV